VFLFHEIPVEEVEPLAAQLAGVPELSKAYLVKKAVELFPEDPAYRLICVPYYVWYKFTDKQLPQRLAKNVVSSVAGLPNKTLVIAAAGSYKFVEAKAKKVNGALIYSRR